MIGSIFQTGRQSWLYPTSKNSCKKAQCRVIICLPEHLPVSALRRRYFEVNFVYGQV
jgi:hypothetical protein